MWTLSVLAITHLETPPGTIITLDHAGCGPAKKRNAAIDKLLAVPTVEWIFFLDADMTPEPKALMRLLGLDVPVAGALCYQRVPPFYQAIGTLGQKTIDVTSGPFEVAWTGGAALLVRREVFEALAPGPFFEYQDGYAAGEDVNFCKLVREAGFPILIDPDVQVGHVGAISVDQELAAAWYSIRGAQDSGGMAVDGAGSG